VSPLVPQASSGEEPQGVAVDRPGVPAIRRADRAVRRYAAFRGAGPGVPHMCRSSSVFAGQLSHLDQLSGDDLVVTGPRLVEVTGAASTVIGRLLWLAPILVSRAAADSGCQLRSMQPAPHRHGHFRRRRTRVSGYPSALAGQGHASWRRRMNPSSFLGSWKASIPALWTAHGIPPTGYPKALLTRECEQADPAWVAERRRSTAGCPSSRKYASCVTQEA